MTKAKVTNSTIDYVEVESSGFKFWTVFAFFALLFIAGLWAFNYIHQHGHHVTGMNNQIVWGIPHVFAVFLILAASGCANISTLGSVFKKPIYQPQGRFSLLLAASLLMGGLIIILFDLGRIDHVIEMLKGALNFSSVFAWNVVLYLGFLLVIAIYLWTMMDRTTLAKSKYKSMAILNFVWRIILTTATGAIFGVLLARHSYEVITMVPLFLAASYAFGTATYSLALLCVYRLINRPLGDVVLLRLRNSLAIFILTVLLVEFIRYLVHTFFINHPSGNALPLLAAGFSNLFWLGQIGLGSLLPLLLLGSSYFSPYLKNHSLAILLSSLLIVIWGLIQLYIIIIGGQSHPLLLFPETQTSSTFSDGFISPYSASLLEYLLGFGGIGLAVCLLMIGIKVLRILPHSLSDSVFQMPDK